ncbi:MAG: transposase [Verrucomicrobiaceae bacterium]|nr:MAG: transposase [Verrucomicrobiaceae bacterium]
MVADIFTEVDGRGRPRLSGRLMLDGVLWVLCSGAAWRDMPNASAHGQRCINGSGVGTTKAHLIRLSNACA